MVELKWSWKCAVHCLIPIGWLPGLFQHIGQNVAYSPDMQLPMLLKLLGCKLYLHWFCHSQSVATGYMNRLVNFIDFCHCESLKACMFLIGSLIALVLFSHNTYHFSSLVSLFGIERGVMFPQNVTTYHTAQHNITVDHNWICICVLYLYICSWVCLFIEQLDVGPQTTAAILSPSQNMTSPSVVSILDHKVV